MLDFTRQHPEYDSRETTTPKRSRAIAQTLSSMVRNSYRQRP